MTRVREHRPVFPFTAIAGQKHLKQALIINAVVPGGVGVLIRGEKGTGKSTCARALACLLPDIPVIRGCSLNCDPRLPPDRVCPVCRKKQPTDISCIPRPFVTLPVNASAENLVGGLDFEHTLKTGKKRFQAGLMAAAHRGILYVDEANLLDDHLVDILTDTSASGINTVEREGVNFIHAAEFSLVATMNPEEGELRPQFLDRFGLSVSVSGIRCLPLRVELLRRTAAFDRNPAAFIASWINEQRREQDRITEAMARYDTVMISERRLDFIAAACLRAGAAGHRAEIFAGKAARALAAGHGRKTVSDRDIRTGLLFALAHRIRTPEGAQSPAASGIHPKDGDRPDAAYYATCLRPSALQPNTGGAPVPFPGRGMNDGSDEGYFPRPGGGGEGVVSDIEEAVTVSAGNIRHQATRNREKSGRRHRSVAVDKRGRYVRFTRGRTGRDIALDATIRAAAGRQKSRPAGPLAINITAEDIREKIREHKARSLLIFVVDASGSMGTRLMGETKGAILSLLLEAYQNRDQVGLIAFRDRKAEILLPPTSSVELAKKKLRDLPAGGKTPLAAGLIRGYDLARSRKQRDHKTRPILILVSDGKANVGADPGLSYSMERAGRIYDEVFSVARAIRDDRLVKTLVINTEPETGGGFGMAERIAEELGAEYVAPGRIGAAVITRAVRRLTQPGSFMTSSRLSR